jgi:hypothetical protein
MGCARPTLIRHGERGSDVIALVDANVVNLDGQDDGVRRTILVRGARIEAVGPTASVPIPRDARRIDARGAWVMPGLSDMHVHLGADAEHWMPLLLTCGVTTVMSLHGGPSNIALRERVRKGELVGPRIFTVGPFANEPNIKTPEDAARLVRDQKAAGYDAIKIHGQLPQETYLRLLEEARRLKISVVGHVPKNLPFETVLGGGQRSIVHAEEIVYGALPKPEERTKERLVPLAPRIRERGIWTIPTLITQRSLTEQWGRPGAIDALIARVPGARWLTEDIRGWWHRADMYGHMAPERRDRIVALNAFVKEVVRALHDAGARITLGTDTPLFGVVPGWSLIEEIDLVTEAGFDRRGALRAATIDSGEYAAEIVPGADRFGRLEPGWSADLVFLKTDPIAQAFSCDDIRGVMTRGRWLDEAHLDRMRKTVAATPSAATRGAHVDAAGLAGHLGVYGDADGFVRVELVGDALVVVDGAHGQKRLVPRSANEFVILDELMRVVVRFAGDHLVIDVEGDSGADLRRCDQTPNQPRGCPRVDARGPAPAQAR